jgi:hypothetical protein
MKRLWTIIGVSTTSWSARCPRPEGSFNGGFPCEVVHSSRIALTLATAVVSSAHGKDGKPNILVIFGDDVGQTNLST